jgi:hypothetical protein
VRKEIRALSTSEWEAVVAAMKVVRYTSTKDGQRLYGRQFKNWDYFVAKHVTCVKDRRGDQGHFATSLMTFHPLLMLEMENAILAVDPSIGAVPYWDWAIQDPPLFTDDYFGSAPGTGPNFQVADGRFPNWPVSVITPDIWRGQYLPYHNSTTTMGFTGTTNSGRFRFSGNQNEFVTRYGKRPTHDFDPSVCTTADVFPWREFNTCLDMGSVRGVNIIGTSIHGSPHSTIGGHSDEGYDGDFRDFQTSINDPIFPFHHNAMDKWRSGAGV